MGKTNNGNKQHKETKPIDLNDESRSSDQTSSSTNDDSFTEIAVEENRQVLASKLFMMIVLFLAAAGVGYSTYKFTTNTEIEEFESSVSGSFRLWWREICARKQ